MVVIGILGCGRIGRMHATNIAAHPRTRLGCIYDAHAAAAADLGSEHGIPVAESAAAIFADPGIDAVLVASTTTTHADYIEMAVSAGKPVLCEKPIDLDLDRVNRCAAAIAGTTVPVQIGFNRRFDPGHRSARDRARAGDIGPLHQVIITSRDPELPSRNYIESAGGLLRDMTIHDFDLARYMLDDEPVEVFAVTSALIDRRLADDLNDADTAMIIMRTANGQQCHINNSRAAVYGYDQRIELMGANGMLISGNRRPNAVEHHTATHTGAAAPYLYFFIERYHDSFMAEISAFADAVENGIAPEVGFEDGRKALILAEAAYRSIAENRFVHIDELD